MLVPTLMTRLTIAALAALFSPVKLVEDVPIIDPVESMNCAIAHSAAAVVNSLTVTKLDELKLSHGPVSAIIASELFTPPPPLPPVATT